MKLYYKPHQQQKKEMEFFNYLIENLPGAVHIHEKYPLPSELLTKTMHTADIISSLQKKSCISDLRKNACLTELKRMPKKIRILKSLKDISVDFTIDVNGKVFYIDQNGLWKFISWPESYARS